jgi:predicted acetylornithine/succinylornithine family transaminase
MSDSLARNAARYPVTFERGEGVWLYDTRGKRYMDFLGGIAVCALGHGHPSLTSALIDQSAKLLHVSNLFYTPEIVAAADALVTKIAPGRVYFCNSGTEANEAAIKAARKFAWRNGEKERNEIVAIEGSFHGRTYGSLAATIQPAKWEGFGPMPGGFTSVPINDVGALQSVMSEKTAAVIIEPIQGEGGIRPLTKEFAQTARRLCNVNGALLICDEIQTGIGRTGSWWGHDHLGIAPDVVTLAKALGGGFPVGATWLSSKCEDALQPSDHATTQGGGPLACAAVLAVLDAIEREGLIENAAKLGEWIAGEIADLGTEVRGQGLLIGLELGKDAAGKVVEAALSHGLIVNNVTPSTVRLAPPLTLTASEAEEGVALLRKAVAEAT